MWLYYCRLLLVSFLLELLVIEPPLWAAGPPAPPDLPLSPLASALLLDRASAPPQKTPSGVKALTRFATQFLAQTNPTPQDPDVRRDLLTRVGTQLLTQASASTQGRTVGADLLDRFGTQNALQQGHDTVIPTITPSDPVCGTDQSCIQQRQLENPYYNQEPGQNTPLNRLGQDASAQAAIDPATHTFQQRATSTSAWSFGTSSSLVDSIQSSMPTGLTTDGGCRSIPFCAVPGATTTEQSCNLTQSFEQISCVESYAIINNQPPLFTDGCTDYKQSPWFAREGVCLDPPETPRCQPYQQTRQYTSCTDHWIDIGLVQEGNTIVLQKWDDDPGQHANCGADYFELDRLPKETFNGPISMDIAISGPGNCKGTATVALGQRVTIFNCGNDYHASNTITWTSSLLKCLDCWNLDRTFGNITTLSNTCDPLQLQGCTPSGQTCLTDDCTNVERVYTCSTPSPCSQWDTMLICSACIPDPPNPPKCVDETFPPNSDFGIAAAAMEGQVTMARDKTGEPEFFPGAVQECRDTFLTDCCALGDETAEQVMLGIDAAQTAVSVIMKAQEIIDFAKGLYQAYQAAETLSFLAESLGQMLNAMFAFSTFTVVMIVIQIVIRILMYLMECKQDDIGTATKVELNVCHRVGRYCSVSALICVEHQTSHCCFSTVLARIIQEEVRAQLGISWGSKSNPDCRGLTVTQLQITDWSKIDLTEYLDDLTHRMHWPDATHTDTVSTAATTRPYDQAANQALHNVGGLATRIQADIAPPGGWQQNTQTSITLAVTINGAGTVTVNPGAFTCAGGSCNLLVAPNQPLTITATPAMGGSFEGWSGACTGTLSPCTLTPSAPTTLTATFPATAYPLTVGVIGNGTITSTPPGLTCTANTCTALFPIGTVVTLTATPPTSSSTFEQWGRDCTGAAPCQVTINAPHLVTATFSGTPIITSLTDNVTFPVPATTTIAWTAVTSGGVQPIEYRWIRTNSAGVQTLVQEWSTSDTYLWVPTPADAGIYQITLLVRNSGSASEFEDYRTTASFEILPPLSITAATPSSGARGTTFTIILTGSGFRIGDAMLFTRSTSIVPGMTVSAITPIGSSQLSATLTIDSNAPTGLTDVIVIDPDGTSAIGSSLFTITL